MDERTALINRLRELFGEHQERAGHRLPPTMRQLIDDQVTAFDQLDARLAYAAQITAQAALSEVARQL